MLTRLPLLAAILCLIAAYAPAGQVVLIENGRARAMIVLPAVWHYEVSGKHVLRQWFSYRQKDRSRPIMGDRRPPSKLAKYSPTTGPPNTPPT